MPVLSRLGSSNRQHKCSPSNSSFLRWGSNTWVGTTGHRPVNRYPTEDCSIQLGSSLVQLFPQRSNDLVGTTDTRLGQSYQSYSHQKYRRGRGSQVRQHPVGSSTPVRTWSRSLHQNRMRYLLGKSYNHSSSYRKACHQSYPRGKLHRYRPYSRHQGGKELTGNAPYLRYNYIQKDRESTHQPRKYLSL